MEINYTELFGYCASAVIAFSLTRSSIVQLRWINLFGASSMCLYGVIINAYPVVVLNAFITLTNIFYIRKFVYHTNHDFTILRTQSRSHYMSFFLDYHRDEIKQFFPKFFKRLEDDNREFYVLLDGTKVVGVISGIKHQGGEESGIIVDFDFVVPQYRDCRLGVFALGAEQGLKKLTGYQLIGAKADSVEHERYLETLNFKPAGKGIWTYQGGTQPSN